MLRWDVDPRTFRKWSPPPCQPRSKPGGWDPFAAGFRPGTCFQRQRSLPEKGEKILSLEKTEDPLDWTQATRLRYSEFLIHPAFPQSVPCPPEKKKCFLLHT